MINVLSYSMPSQDCKIRSKRSHISNTLQTNTEHWASFEGGTDIRVVCTPPLVADLSDTRQNCKAQISQPRKGVSSIKSLGKEPNRIFSKLIKSLVFNLIGLFNFIFFIKEEAKSIPVFHTSS